MDLTRLDETEESCYRLDKTIGWLMDAADEPQSNYTLQRVDLPVLWTATKGRYPREPAFP